MLLALKNNSDIRSVWPETYWCLLLLFCCCTLLPSLDAAEEGDACEGTGYTGICMLGGNCTRGDNALSRGEINQSLVPRCGYSIYEEIVCCPVDKSDDKSTTKPPETVRPTPQTSATTIITPGVTRVYTRPAERACIEIDARLEPALTTHIIGGAAVDIGDFPHMAAIGYSRIGGSGAGPYDYRCGGTLIEKRFVLTAAHCVSSTRDNKPEVVVLGVTDITNVQQMLDGVQVKIKETLIHPDYTNSKRYNDIALLELDRAVKFSDRIRPTCLYIHDKDPPSSSNFVVTGWGTIDTRTRKFSNKLLGAKLELMELDMCNRSYVDAGLTRQIDRGIVSSQLCAYDSNLQKDACQGDSGGPLNLVLDEASRKIRVIGIVSTGFSCATATPGLYTRVSSYVTWIESVVWPTTL